MKTFKDVWSDKLKGVAHVVDPKRISPSQITAKAKAKSNDNRHLKLVKEENGVAANAVQGGNTAGLGGENGEPGVGKKKKRVVMKDVLRRAMPK